MRDYSKSIILIPTYNEKENIVALVRTIFDKMPQVSVLVVDDNSPDGTADAVLNLKNSFSDLDIYKRTADKGFGRSYLDGFKKILSDGRYEYVVIMDADLSHDPGVVPDMLDKLSDYDVVVGSRYVKGGGISNWNFKRRILSQFANFYARTILGIPVSDLTTGFMCLKKDTLKNVDLNSIQSDGYAFLIELKYKLHEAGYKITEHPIIFAERREGQSKMSSKIIWEAIWLPWRLKFGN